MKKTILVGFIALATTGVSFAQKTVWNLDKSHSQINFAVDHLVISETTGKFNDFSINVKADKADFTDVVVDFTAQIKSINTDDTKRDEHLKGSDFFNAEKFPTITFKGKKFTKVKGNIYKVYGNLTMHGVTKSVVLNAKFGGIVKDPWGGTRTGLKVFGEIDRYDYDLKYNSVMEAGGLSIGRMIRINCNIELVKA
ncbi:MAG: YceI family protein [Sphingobacteriaceae bacterium]|nr:YceI family protein [Sphingobacteriaceae bacterium]